MNYLFFTDVVLCGSKQPNQLEAKTTEGHFVYFRGDWGWLSLQVTKNESDLYDDIDLIWSSPDDSDASIGWDDDEQFLQRFKRLIADNKIGEII